jgi:DNA repair protein RadC
MSEEHEKLTIKSWAEDDRPREKLMLKGKGALSDAELLAILIGSGNSKETAVDLCKRILQQANNNLTSLAKHSINDLMKFKGIGEAKAISIVAALELGRRLESSSEEEREKITASKDAYRILKGNLADLPHEEFWALYLNRANKVIEKSFISRGGVSGTVADFKIIFKRGLELLASSVVLAHNHPSGNLTPSDEDRKITKKFNEAARLLDMSLTDHIIITDSGYYSFRDEGQIS